MFDKIVIGIDGSAASHHALRVACSIAQKYVSELHVVHTPQPQTVAFALGAVAGYHTVTTMPSAPEVKAAGQKILNDADAIAKGCGQEITATFIEQGDPADQITAYAQGRGADLIVTGRRGLGAIGALVQGSTTQRVHHLAGCACLSVV